MVVPPKCINLLFRILDRREPMHVQTFLAEPSVEGFERGVVGRFPAPAEVENDAVGVCPQIYRGTDELRPVVTVDTLRQSAVEAQPEVRLRLP